jgi:hypothetical protein
MGTFSPWPVFIAAAKRAIAICRPNLAEPTVRGAGQPARNADGDFIPSMTSWRRLDVCGDSVTAVT